MNILRQHKQQQNMSLDKPLFFSKFYTMQHVKEINLDCTDWHSACCFNDGETCALHIVVLLSKYWSFSRFSAKALAMAISPRIHHGSAYIFVILCFWLPTRAMKKMFLYDTALVMDEFKLLVTRTCLRSLLQWFVIRAKA